MSIQTRIKIVISLAQYLYRDRTSLHFKYALLDSFEKNFPKHLDLSDKSWFYKKILDVKSAMDRGENANDWLENQLREFNIFKLELEHDPGEKCFAFALKHQKTANHAYYVNAESSLQDRFTQYIQYETQGKLSEEALNCGDAIIYQGNSNRKYTHIARYIGKINSTQYAFSKLGQCPAYIHPVDALNEIYGTPIFFKVIKQHIKVGVLGDQLQKCIRENIGRYSTDIYTIFGSAQGVNDEKQIDSYEQKAPIKEGIFSVHTRSNELNKQPLTNFLYDREMYETLSLRS